MRRSRILAAFMVLVFMAGLFGCNNSPAAQAPSEPVTLFAYVGANLKDPVSELAQAYEEKTGVKVELSFNNSGTLLGQLEIMEEGDIYMPGGMPFVEAANQKGHLESVDGPVAYHTPVIVTPKGNPAGITSVEDLAKEGTKLVIPDKEATAIGKTAFKIFNKLGIAEEVEKNILSNAESPAKVMAAITMGQGNAGIVEFSNTFKDRDKIEVVEIDPEINEIEEIPVALLKYSSNKEQAADFIEFVMEEGPAAFEKYGFKTRL